MNMTGQRLFTLAALTLLAVACNREAISPDEGHERLIDFSAYFAQDATKAQGEITGTVFPANDSIGVFACYTGDMVYDLTSVSPDFMYDQKVTYDGSNWTYSPVKYWPNNESEKISFFSYYPYISSEKALTAEDGIIGFSKSYAKGDPWLVYKLPKEAPYSQKDLMYGTPQLNKEKPAPNASGEKINFVMKHALACIADSVTVQMSPELYTKMHDSLDISITGLRIVYSNLTNKARLVLNSTTEPIWKEVISGELQTSRTYSKQDITDQKFSKDVAENTVLTIDEEHGLFYIPMQIEGQPKPEVRVTLSYRVDGLEDHGSFTDSVVTVKQFTIGDAGKKQRLALKLTKDFNLDADIITEADNGISMPGDLLAWDQDVDVAIDTISVKADTLSYTGEVQTFRVPRTGTYRLRAWGAQGGAGSSNAADVGAKGGYAEAKFDLSIGDVLYIYVGGKGGDATIAGITGGSGGWNGGGQGGAPNGNYYGGGGGGGATHIAVSPIGIIGSTSVSKLNAYVGSEGALLLVAGGGGGGAWKDNSAGSGGGEEGTRGGYNEDEIVWNNSDYSYGRIGGNGGSGQGGLEGNGGGGGGYEGGNAKYTVNTDEHPSTGGSGGSSKANTARYNYVSESFSTNDGKREGDGQVIIKFEEKISL